MKKTNILQDKKKYVCAFENCQKSYSLKNILLAHIRTHYKIKPFICTYCSKSFNEKGNLKTHVRIHTGERPFKCKKCQKSFKALSQLKDHFISHTGLKPFQCPFCKKYYRRKEILKNHFEIHKKDEFFKKNEDKYKEMKENINKMKNMILDFEDRNFVYKNVKEKGSNNTNNIINSTGSGTETNLSCSVISNDDSKQSVFNDKKIDIKKFKTLKEENKKNEEEIKDENIILEKDKELKEHVNLNLFSNTNLIKDIILFNDSIDFKNHNFSDILTPNNFDNIKEENDSNLFYEENSIESKDFSLQKIPDITEKEINITNNLNIDNINNMYCSEENTEKEIENYDCYSKITNLYFQTYQHKMNISI